MISLSEQRLLLDGHHPTTSIVIFIVTKSERLRAEGNSRDHLVQLPCSGRVAYSVLQRPSSRQVVDVSIGHSAASLGNLFQGSVMKPLVIQKHNRYTENWSVSASALELQNAPPNSQKCPRGIWVVASMFSGSSFLPKSRSLRFFERIHLCIDP